MTAHPATNNLKPQEAAACETLRRELREMVERLQALEGRVESWWEGMMKGSKLIGCDLGAAEKTVISQWVGMPASAYLHSATTDVHTRRAADMFKVAYEAVTEPMRRIAKQRNFSEAYGSTGEAMISAIENTGSSRLKQASGETYMQQTVAVDAKP